MSKHTPGPWVIDPDWLPDEHPDWRCIIIKLDDKHLRTSISGHIGEANARLIAAAPDLKERLQSAIDALDRLTDLIDGTGFSYSAEFGSALDEIDQARAAIAKVDGKS